jgi:hypothetical protein
MLTMDLTWLLWLAIIVAGLFWISIFLAATEASARLGDLLLNPPKPSAPKETPEEEAASKARAFAMMTQVKKSRAAHHH